MAKGRVGMNPQRAPMIGVDMESLHPAPSMPGLGQAGDAQLPGGPRLGKGLKPNRNLRTGAPSIGGKGPGRMPMPKAMGPSPAGPAVKMPGKPKGIRGTSEFKTLMGNLSRRR